MRCTVICNTIAASAFYYLVCIGLAHIAQIVGDGIESKGRFITAGRCHRRRGRIWQFSAIRASHRKGEGIPLLKLSASNDLFPVQCRISAGFVGILEYQAGSIVIDRFHLQSSVLIRIRNGYPYLMSIRVIGHAIAASALFHLVCVGLAHIIQVIGNGIERVGCFVSLRRLDGLACRIWQFSAVRTGHCEGKGISALKLSSRDDLFPAQCRFSAGLIRVLKCQMLPVIVDCFYF